MPSVSDLVEQTIDDIQQNGESLLAKAKAEDLPIVRETLRMAGSFASDLLLNIDDPKQVERSRNNLRFAANIMQNIAARYSLIGAQELRAFLSRFAERATQTLLRVLDAAL